MPKITCSLKTSAKKWSALPLAGLRTQLSTQDWIQLDGPRDYVKFRGIARDIVTELNEGLPASLMIRSAGSVLKMQIVSQTVDMSADEKKKLAARKLAVTMAKVALHGVTGGTSLAAQVAAEFTLHALDLEVVHLAKQLFEKGVKQGVKYSFTPPFFKGVCVRICPATGSYMIKSGWGLFGKVAEFPAPVCLRAVSGEIVTALSRQSDGYALLLDDGTFEKIANDRTKKERAIAWLTEQAKAKFGARGITLATRGPEDKVPLLTEDASDDDVTEDASDDGFGEDSI